LSKIFVDQIEPKTTNSTIKFGHKPFIVVGHLSSNQTTTHNAYTKIAFDTARIDTDSVFDTINNRYQPTQHGYYEIYVNAFLTTQVSRNMYQTVFIYKNGSALGNGLGRGTHSIQTVGSGGGYGTSSTTIVELNGSTDYIDFSHYHYDYTNTTTGELQASEANYFTAKLLKDL
tara:strand:- start:1399 stop:1917 length:519 start_codon:yes stop_codon:yes gene_type:complete